MDTLIYLDGDLQVYFLGPLQSGKSIYRTYLVGLNKQLNIHCEKLRFSTSLGVCYF